MSASLMRPSGVTYAARLSALKKTGLLDSPPEEAFDRLTQLARRVLNVPIVLLSLVDSDRQFFKSVAGLPEPWASRRETPLTHSFCQYVVSTGKPLQISDAPSHPLVCDNCAVTELGVVAYMGFPLITADSYVLGSFCAIDSKPRVWTVEEEHCLADCTALAMTEIHLRAALTDACEQTIIAQEAERARQKDARRYQSIVDVLREVVFQTDLSGRWTFLNPAWTEITGQRIKDVLGQPWHQFLHPEDRATGITRFDALMARRMDQCLVELRFGGRGGNFRWCEMHARLNSDENGRVSGIAGTITDITERRAAQEELRRSREQFELAVCGSKDGLWDWDIANNRVYYAPRWKAMLGYGEHELADVVESWSTLLHPEDAARVHAAVADHLAGRTPAYEVEYRLAHRDGDYRWILARGIALRGNDGKPYRIAGSHTDITERKRAEEQLQERTAELCRSNKALEDFAAIASHDLQEPLRKIQSFGDRLRSKHFEALNPEARDYLERMLGAAGRMQTLIADLLRYSRVASKAQPFVCIDLNEIIQGVLSDLETGLQRVNGRVDCGNLPALSADPLQMRQLFQNLIANALKFRREGISPVVTIRAEIVEAGALCRISVSDNGIGFEERYAERIFDVFERLHTRTEYEGNGIGLSICLRIVQRHGGTIVAQGVPDQGATFIVILPVRPSSLVGEEKERS